MTAFLRQGMMTWLIVVVLVVAGVYVLLRQLNKPKYYRGITRDAFPKFINDMMAQGGHRFLLFFEHEGSNRFLQFAKYIENPYRPLHALGRILPPGTDAYGVNTNEILARATRCIDEPLHASECGYHRTCLTQRARSSHPTS